MAFFTTDEWSQVKKYDGLTNTLKWGDVPQERIFLLISIEKKENAKFDTHILHFVDAKEEEFHAYAPSHFLRSIRKTRTKNQRPYFVSHGTIKKGDGTMASFEISYKDENKAFDIFE